MDRRHFIKSAIISGTALMTVPQLAFRSDNNLIPYAELIGKEKPKLFGKAIQLRKEAYDAFLDMRTQALKSDIHIQIVSSYRSFYHQNRIWERKFRRYTNQGLTPEQTINKIIRYSTIPGTSRHHWATEIDIIDANTVQPSSVLQPKHFETDGCYRNLKLWMDAHANEFGFYLAYTNVEHRKGFKYEPWHYSYKPLSRNYLKQFQTLTIKTIIANENLMGNQHFTNDFITKYLNENILDINPELL